MAATSGARGKGSSPLRWVVIEKRLVIGESLLVELFAASVTVSRRHRVENASSG